MTEIESNTEDEGEEGLTLVQRVAIVMLALGEETSGEVMKYLTDREVEEITEALATLKNVSAEVMDKVLEEFEGCVDGMILEEGKGAGGFGYDPLFVPEGHTQSFAELGPCIKNSLSHRARAMEKVVAWLRLAG